MIGGLRSVANLRWVKALPLARRLVIQTLVPPARPSFLILGAQKGGTTALYRYLGRHPAISLPLRKEINYFVRDGGSWAERIFHAHFPSRWPGRGSVVTFDDSPAYLHNSLAAQRIFAYDPQIKLIVVLRDPVHRAFSAWQMYRGRFRADPGWHRAWVERFEPEKRGVYKPRRSFGEDFLADLREEHEALANGARVEAPILTVGSYSEQLRRYLELFPPHQLLVLFSEEMRADTRAALERVEDFLELPAHGWSNEELKPQFEGGYRERASAEAVAWLTDFYRAPNDALESLLGRSLPWKTPS